MMTRAGLVIWCLFICVKGDRTGYDIVNPTPVVISDAVQSTDASSPLEGNKQAMTEFFTTGIATPNDDDIVSPTPVLQEFHVTDAAIPLSNEDAPVIKQTNNNILVSPSVPNLMETNADSPLHLSAVINEPMIIKTNAHNSINANSIVNVPKVIETMANNPIMPSSIVNIPVIMETNADKPVNPSPIIDVPVIMETIPSYPANPNPVTNVVKLKETNADNPMTPSTVIDVPMIIETNVNKPLFYNKHESSLLTTTVSKDDVKPTPVVIVVADSETMPMTIGLTNNDTTEPPLPSTWSLIEPSQVFDIKSSEAPLSTDVATPNLESQEPIHILSTRNPPKAESAIKSCTCSYYLTPTTIPELLSDVLEDTLIPEFSAPEKPKKDIVKPPISIFQRLYNIQINYIINNFPVPVVNPTPFYIMPR